MLIPLEELVDGLVRTLTEVVLPDVGTRFARGQVYAVVDVLRNLRDRIEERAEILLAEADAAASALAGAATALRAAGAPAAAERIDRTLATAVDLPAAPRVAALRAAVVATLETVDGLATRTGEPARRALGAYLVAQAMTDVTRSKPSLLGEISRG